LISVDNSALRNVRWCRKLAYVGKVTEVA